MNKQGQGLAVPIITFVVLIIGIIILAPILLKVVNEVQGPLNESFSGISPEASEEGSSVFEKFKGMFDIMILIIFFLLIVVMLISAFLVDVHPAFLLVYIVFAFFLFIIAPSIMDAVDRIYESNDFAEEQGDLPITDFLRQSFGVIMVAVYVLTGVILFAKLRGGGGSDV
jgi:hypothetical protein